LLSKDSFDLDKKLKNLLGLFRRSNTSVVFLLLLLIVVSIITYYRILVQIQMGPISDSFDFLSNALIYAGQGTGYGDLLRPPVFGFLISLVFRLGYISTNVVFYMDGLLFIFGVIGMFFLLRTRFSNFESFFGALLYSTFPIVITIVGVGFSDLASVSFTIWTFYFLILAVKKDSKYFYLVFPLAMVSFLTRYNNALLIFPIFLYLLIHKDELKFRNIFGGIAVSLGLLCPVLLFFYQKFGSIIYPFINFSTTSSTVVSSESAAYYPNPLFFLDKLPDFTGPQGSLILAIVILGFIGIVLPKIYVKLRKNSIKDYFNGLNAVFKIKLLIWIILALIFVGSFAKTTYFFNEFIFFILAYLTYDIVKNYDLKSVDVDILILTWFMAFFIFHSIFVIKDNRYFILMAPPVAYFMLLGLKEVVGRIKIANDGRNIVFPFFSVVLILLMLFSATSQVNAVLESNNDKLIANQDMIKASDWLINHDPSYKEKNIYSDLWPNFSWYLKMNVKQVPVFKDNQTFPNGIKDYNFNQEDSNVYNQYLTSNNAYYYISVRSGLNLTSYTPIKVFDNVTIYQRK